MAWYEEAFDEIYLDIYKHRDEGEAYDDVMFANKVLKLDNRKTVLDLCCGAGRHALAFSKIVKQIVGFDLSYPLLKVASNQALNEHCQNIYLLKGNMLHLKFQQTFDAVSSFFNSFGYFENEDEHMKVLGNVFSSLNKGGYFLLDIMNSDYLKNNIKGETRRTIGPYVITEKRQIHDKNSRVIKSVLIQLESDLSEIKKYIESVHFFSKTKIESMLMTAGFQNIQFYGSSASEPLTSNSKRMLVVSMKPI